MQKIGISVAMGVWGFIATIILKSFLTADVDIISAFSSIEYAGIQASVVGYAEFEGLYDDAEELVSEVAASLGMSAPYDIVADEINGRKTVVISKEGLYGDGYVEAVTVENSLHLGVKLGLKDNLNTVHSYEALVRKIFEEKGVSGSVNIYLEGEIEGALNSEERTHIAKIMLNELDAKIVSENKGDIYTVYAYTDRIDRYVTSIGRKINLNLSVSYDEIKNRTILYLATPINNLDY